MLKKSGVNSMFLQSRKFWPVRGLQLAYSNPAQGKFGSTALAYKKTKKTKQME